MSRERRRRKKAAKRGRVATPMHMMPGGGRMMAGGKHIPAFQGGGAIYDQTHPSPDYYSTTGPEIRYDSNTDTWWYSDPGSGEWQQFTPPGGGAQGGGGGPVGLTQFEQDLMARRQQLAEQELAAQTQIANLDRQAEIAIATGNRRSAEQIEAQRRYM